MIADKAGAFVEPLQSGFLFQGREFKIMFMRRDRDPYRWLVSAFVVLIIGFVGSLPVASAFESYPEYYSLLESELEEGFEGPNVLGSEYVSDILTYQKPVEWNLAHYSAPVHLDAGWGSVSPAHFYVQNRVRLRRTFDTARWFEFRFTYFADRDREVDQEHAIFEAVFLPWQKFGVALYGQPSLYKRQTDVGLALLWRPLEKFEVRLFQTWVDLTRIRRNDRTDTYDRSEIPYSRGVVARYAAPDRLYELAVRRETPTQQIFPESGLRFRYFKNLVSWHVIHPFGAERKFRLLSRARYDKKLERTDQSGIVTSWVTRRLQLYHELQWRSPIAELAPGYQYAHRSWKTTSGDVYYHDHSLYLKFRRPWFASSWSKTSYEITPEVTFHSERGDLGLRGGVDLDGRTEYRLSLTPVFQFAPEAELRLQFTFDLDRFGKSDTWEGGNAQLAFQF